MAILGRHPGTSRLKVKGFSSAERRQLKSLPEDQQTFVIEHQAELEALKFKPLDMLSLAQQPPESRDFALGAGHLLSTFTPSEITSCSLLPREQRTFIAQLHDGMHRYRMPPEAMMRLANVPQEHHQFFITYWQELGSSGADVDGIQAIARMPLTNRNMLIFNIFYLRHHQFSDQQWQRIATFNERQCLRLITEGTNPLADPIGEQFLDDISQDAPTPTAPENLNWLDDTSRTSIQRWSRPAHLNTALLKISVFCSDAMSGTFLARLQKDPAAQPLGTLVAGLVFTAGYQKKPE